MIPRRIRLHNFLSYSDCELNLAGLQLAVLSGKNGDGKSALLDGMTWALWGQGRGDSEDDRIRTGTHDMSVEFDFEADGGLFRVVRKRSRGKTGEVNFFQVRDDGGLTPRTGGTSRQTQEAITACVRMDYDTFVSSAFLAQGRSDEFTSKAPAQRKEVFRKILGLGLYETLAERATIRKKDAEGELRQSARWTDEAEKEVALLPGVTRAIEDGTAAAEALQPSIKAAEDAAMELGSLHNQFEKLAGEARQAAERHQRVADAVAADEARLETLLKDLCAAHELLQHEEEVRTQHAALLSTRARERELAGLQARAMTLRHRQQELQGIIAAAEARLRAQVEGAEHDVAELRKGAARRVDLEQAEARFSKELTPLAALATRTESAREELKRAEAAVVRAESEARRCKEENRVLHEKGEELKALEGEKECPVCRQPLSPDDIQHVLDEYSAQRKQLGERYTRAQAHRDRATAEASRLQGEVDRLVAEHDRAEADLNARRREHHAALSAAREAAERLPAREAALAGLADELAGEMFEPGARQELKATCAEYATIGYDPANHANVREQLDALAPAEARMRDLAAATERAAALAGQQRDLSDSLAGRRAELEEASAARAAAERALELGEDVGPRLREAEGRLSVLRDQERELTRQLGALGQQRENLIRQKAKLEEEKERSQARRDEAETYGQLASAFGRDGIQAMLIDQAIPRVEHVANAMLDRMTGGRITVQLSTQRTMAKGVKETLDILISDELGTRDYSMYSGGEAFRVDFALRIALARLLAENAGAELPTLIIDEGFGSQDAEGIDRLVEAINAVSTEFRLILVVTHVEELRQRFEQRIEVTKDPVRGSFARVA